MALCWLLSQQVKKKKDAVIHALTVDHGLRPESSVEARQVALWVKGWPGIRHSILRIKNLSSGSSRLMERAREERYRVMASYCHRHKIKQIFLAHHRDDQAETLLFRLAKGSGLDGLAGMRPLQAYNDRLSLVRPLLDVPKSDLVMLCRKYKISYVEDPTNTNTVYARSRLRQALNEEGATAKRLAVTAARLSQAREALEHYTKEVTRSAQQEKTKNRTVFAFEILAAAPADIRLRVLMAAVRDGYGPRLEKMEALVSALFSEKPFRRQTLGGVVWSRDRKKGLIVLEQEKT